MSSEQRSPTDPGRRAARVRQRRLAAAGGAAIIAGGVTGGIVLSTRGPDLSFVNYTTLVPQAKSAPSTGPVLDPPPLLMPALGPPLAAQQRLAQMHGSPVAPAAAPVVAAAAPKAPPAVVTPPPAVAGPAVAAPPPVAAAPAPAPPPPPKPKPAKPKPKPKAVTTAPPPAAQPVSQPAAAQQPWWASWFQAAQNQQGQNQQASFANPGHGGVPPGQARKAVFTSGFGGGPTASRMTTSSSGFHFGGFATPMWGGGWSWFGG